MVVPAHLIDHERPVEEASDDFPKTEDHYLHNHVHVRTGVFGFPGITLQIALEAEHRETGRKRIFVFEGSIRDSLHMAQLIKTIGLQVPSEHW